MARKSKVIQLNEYRERKFAALPSSQKLRRDKPLSEEEYEKFMNTPLPPEMQEEILRREHKQWRLLVYLDSLNLEELEDFEEWRKQQEIENYVEEWRKQQEIENYIENEQVYYCRYCDHYAVPTRRCSAEWHDNYSCGGLCTYCDVCDKVMEVVVSDEEREEELMLQKEYIDTHGVQRIRVPTAEDCKRMMEDLEL